MDNLINQTYVILTTCSQVVRGKEFTRLKEGDVCILEDKVPRGQWKLGKIETLLTGKDM